MSTVNAYQTHRWNTSVQPSTPNGPEERIRICEDCGVEDLGDPNEFEHLWYPDCDSGVDSSPLIKAIDQARGGPPPVHRRRFA